jgi:deazaflavin-dependent oxidoreductase (nitroreductase family)
MRRVGRAKWYPRIGRLFPPLDVFLNRVTGGRLLLSRSAVPSAVLVHTGRRSRRALRTALSFVRFGDGYAIGDSCFGLHRRPDWSRNLAAEPRARIELGGKSVEVRARRASSDEAEEVWPRFLVHWPPAALYPERCGREIWIWVLEPTA